jgi:hypothetical protein
VGVAGSWHCGFVGVVWLLDVAGSWALLAPSVAGSWALLAPGVAGSWALLAPGRYGFVSIGGS